MTSTRLASTPPRLSILPAVIQHAAYGCLIGLGALLWGRVMTVAVQLDGVTGDGIESEYQASAAPRALLGAAADAPEGKPPVAVR